MAIDTRQKRFSMLGFDQFDEVLFQADGAVDADDRAHLLGLYSGIALDTPGDGGPATGVSRDNIAPVRKQRRLAWRMRARNT